MSDLLSPFDHDGRRYVGYSRQSALDAGVPLAVVDAAELAATRAAMRCTPRQARLALDAAGLLVGVEAYMATAPKAVQIDWEFASAFERGYGALVSAAADLGMTDAQVDALFADAMSR